MFRRLLPLAVCVMAAAALAGCASGTMGGIFSSAGGNSGAAMPPVTFAPVIGAPGNVASALTGQLETQARQKNIPVVASGQPAQYTVRGYLAASPDRTGNKLAYIWDVTDQSGKRVHRVLGEETAPSRGSDVWASFDQTALQKIAEKTTTDLAAWLSGQGPAAPQPVVASQRDTTPTGSTAPTPPQRSAAVANPPRGEMMAYVPDVSGAPGDGRKSLTAALKKQLQAKGVRLATNTGANVYTVRGDVDLGHAVGGQQDIKIDWKVLSPTGESLGTVSQANKIPQGSLDGAWGQTADMAAGAAADGIVKLMPQR